MPKSCQEALTSERRARRRMMRRYNILLAAMEQLRHGAHLGGDVSAFAAAAIQRAKQVMHNVRRATFTEGYGYEKDQ